MKMKYWLYLSIVFFALTGCATQTAAPGKANWYPNIVDYEFVKQNATIPVKAGVQVIDARPKSRKYDAGHIPGALSIPDSMFNKMTAQLPKDKSTMLIFYCGGVKCMLSHKSAFKAEKLGYSNIKVYANGFPDWKKNGGLVGVDVAHIKKQMDKGANMVVIDSRPKKRKYDKAHIPGAISIPDSSFAKMTDKLPKDKATPLYFYCGGLKCKLSPNSAAKAIKLGYTKVSVVPGGFPAWKKAYGKGGAAKPPAVKKGSEDGTISVASFEEIMSAAPGSMLIVDVRDAEEFAEGTIKGAVNYPINDFEKHIDGLPTNKTIVFVCGTGGRAGEAYDMVQMFRAGLKTYFLNAEIDFNKDGSYKMKEL